MFTAFECRLKPMVPPHRLIADRGLQIPKMESLASRSAMNEVFAILELLEMILLHLDMRTLLVSASCVSKRWSGTMANSHQIQQALFFQPKPLPSSAEVSILNPLLVEHFGEVFFDLDGETILNRRADSLLGLPWSLETVRAPQGSIAILEPTSHQKRFTRSGASWRRMFVSQPPPQFLGFIWFDVLDTWFQRVQTTLVRPAPLSPSHMRPGLVMGQLYDTVQHFLCQAADFSVSFKISWNEARPSSPTPLCLKACGDLLKRTNVVVEFHKRCIFSDWAFGPYTMAAIRNTVESQDFAHPDIGDLSEVHATEFEGIGFDTENIVYWLTES